MYADPPRGCWDSSSLPLLSCPSCPWLSLQVALQVALHVTWVAGNSAEGPCSFDQQSWT